MCPNEILARAKGKLPVLLEMYFISCFFFKEIKGKCINECRLYSELTAGSQPR